MDSSRRRVVSFLSSEPRPTLLLHSKYHQRSDENEHYVAAGGSERNARAQLWPPIFCPIHLTQKCIYELPESVFKLEVNPYPTVQYEKPFRLRKMWKTNAFFAPLSSPIFSWCGYAISTLVLEAAQNCLRYFSGLAELGTLVDQKIYVTV